MAEINYLQWISIEDFLQMSGGYVLDFSNRTLQDFVADVTKLDIYSSKYEDKGESKANRIRTFFKKESATIVAKLLQGFIDYKVDIMYARDGIELGSSELKSLEICKSIVGSLYADGGDVSEDVEALNINDDFTQIFSSIKDDIEKGEPEQALDRLHTFMIKYVKSLCNKNSILYRDEAALHSLYGSYVKEIIKHKVDSEMTVRIMKSSISILEAFNDVRNNQSLAHDNIVLNREESMYIFKSISNLVAFIKAIETKE